VAGTKLFGRYNELVMMVLGFLLTGLVGSFIAQRYTTKNAELAAANKIFADHIQLIGNRYYAMTRIQRILEDNQKTPGKWDASHIDISWDAYRAEVQKWNAIRGYDRELIRLYFGNELYNKERDIHYSFRAWGESLELEQRRSGSVDFKCLDKRVDDFLTQWHTFSFALAEAIQKSNIGSNKPNLIVKESPRPPAPCLTDNSIKSGPP
jgi:hypothetical protein